jgi:hypothetical protein
MGRRLRRRTFVALAIASLWGVSLSLASGATAPHLIGGAHPVTASIRIDLDDTFAPPPRNAKPKISAVVAWRRYTRAAGHPQRRPRAGIKSWIGRFTSNHEAYNKLAYGYELAKPFNCMSTIPNPHSDECREWTFVAADTGRSLGTRFQVLKKAR